jgi:hypothetical protein
MIEIFVRNFVFDSGLIWSFYIADITPVKAVKEGMRFYFISPIPTQAVVCICDHAKKQVGRVGRKICLLGNCKGFFPVQNFLTGN